MKSRLFSSLVLLTLSVSLVSCQEAGTFSVKSATSGSISVSEPESDGTIFCAEAKDLDSCLAQKDLCQPAFEDALDGAEKPYAGCIANPNVGENTSEDPIKNPDAPVVVADPIKLPDAPVVVADPIKVPDAPVVVADPIKVPDAPVVVADPIKVPDAPVVVADPVKVPDAPVVVADPVKVPDAPVVVADPVKVPDAPVIVAEEPKDLVKDIVEEDKDDISDIANAGDCSKLDPKYIFSKAKGQIKVKICHSCAEGAHAIIVACPALKAHVKHQDGKDYLGACKDE